MNEHVARRTARRTSITAGSVTTRAVDFVWRGRFPVGMLSLVAGWPGSGKSLLAALVAADVSQQGVVLLANAEDPAQQVTVPRLEVAGANLDNVRLLSVVLPGDVDYLADEITAHAARLVVLDPIAAHLSVSISRDQDLRRALKPLAALADATDAAVVMVGHTVKSPSRAAHPLATIAGSVALAGAARVVYVFGGSPDDPDERILAPVKSNVGRRVESLAFEVASDTRLDPTGKPLEVAWLEPIGPRAVPAHELLTIDPRPRPRTAPARSEAAEFLVEMLKDGPLPAVEVKAVAADGGIALATLRRAADEDLRVIKIRHGFGPGSHVTWELAPELLDALADDAGPADA